MANSHQLDEKGYGICRCCRRKFFCADLKSCLYCERFVCKRCASKSKRIDGAYVCRSCKGDE